VKEAEIVRAGLLKFGSTGGNEAKAPRTDERKPFLAQIQRKDADEARSASDYDDS
jgi:hypothetical protein